MPRGKLPDGFVDFIQAVIGVPECGLRCYVGADSHLGSLTIISVHDETSVVLSDREKETLILDSLFGFLKTLEAYNRILVGKGKVKEAGAWRCITILCRFLALVFRNRRDFIAGQEVINPVDDDQDHSDDGKADQIIAEDSRHDQSNKSLESF